MQRGRLVLALSVVATASALVVAAASATSFDDPSHLPTTVGADPNSSQSAPPTTLTADNGARGMSPAAASPSGCTVKANDVHMSSVVKSAASADGLTSCKVRVPVIKNQTALYRFYSGYWNAVGDRDTVVVSGANLSSITSTSKENPCRRGSAYASGSWGYAKDPNGKIYSQTNWNQGNWGLGFRIC